MKYDNLTFGLLMFKVHLEATVRSWGSRFRIRRPRQIQVMGVEVRLAMQITLHIFSLRVLSTKTYGVYHKQSDPNHKTKVPYIDIIRLGDN